MWAERYGPFCVKWQILSYPTHFICYVSVNLTLETIVTGLLHAWAICGGTAGIVTTTGARTPEEMSLRPSSRDICPKATHVDNADDCLPMPQTAHTCSEHVRIVCKVSLTHLQDSGNVDYSYSTWKEALQTLGLYFRMVVGSWLIGLPVARSKDSYFLSRDAMLVWYSLNSAGPVSS